MDFQPQTYKIDKIVEWISTGKLALPDFQRDFVWTPAKVAELIDSVSKNWPIGSLLLLDGPQVFSPKAISDGPALREKPEVFVLDGQQRVTALYHAIADVSDVVYYINFEKLENGEEYVLWQKRKDFDKESPALADQAKRLVAKVADVYDTTRFNQWQRSLPRAVGAKMFELRERNLPGLQAKVYGLVGVELEQDIPLEALARIFETINRTGVRLNAFDLMVAVLYPHQFNLRDEWETAKFDHPSFARLGVDGVELLKLIALWERRHQQETGQRLTVRGVRQGDVLALSPERVRDDWQRAVLAYQAALDFGETVLGILGKEGMPSMAMQLTLAFLHDRKEPESLIRAWYWRSIAQQSYSQGANTRVVTDVDHAVAGALHVEWLEEDAANVRATLLEPVRRNRILARGVAGMLVARGARDPVTRRPLRDAKAVFFLPDTSLAAGNPATSTETPIARQIFMESSSVKKAAVEIRKGRRLADVLDASSLREQAIEFGRTQTLDEKLMTKRAAILSQWLFEAVGTNA